MSEPVHIEVEIPNEGNESEPATPAGVTVIETESHGVDGDVTRLIAEHAAEIATLRAELDAANERAFATESAAMVAQNTADLALETTDEAVAEVHEALADAEPETTSDDDVQPKREHWFYRDMRRRS